MFEKDLLQREIEATLGAPGTAGELLNAKRENGLQFMIDARRDQTTADVAAIFHGISERFEVEPLFPAPRFTPPGPDEEPAWGDTLFLAAVRGVAFDDITATAWDIAHAARAEGGFARVIPEIPRVVPEMPADAEPTATSAPDGWEHKAMRIKEAWDELARHGRTPGKGIFIAHPDSGWVKHQVWEKGGLDTDRQQNFMPNETETDATDPLNGAQPGHGNSTASVMVARRGGKITGVAPDAVVLPLRCISTVVLYPFQPNVMRAVRYAMDKKCPIISLSIGGSAYPFLGAQLVHAANADIIVVAASGNKTFVTVEPANYHEVIGVGGMKYEDKEWEHSAWFPAGTVDISAPAADVRKAAYSAYDQYDTSEGTSYATAFMAGVAALWLSRHFPNGYSGKRKAFVTFREHVRRTVRKVPGIGNGLYGVVDAEQLMKTDPKPDTADAASEAPTDFTGVAMLARLLGTESVDAARGLFAAALGEPDVPTDSTRADLDLWADEAVSILLRNPDLRVELVGEASASTITAERLRSGLSPEASNALRGRFAAAQLVEG